LGLERCTHDGRGRLLITDFPHGVPRSRQTQPTNIRSVALLTSIGLSL
jgi:hypothetical protein